MEKHHIYTISRNKNPILVLNNNITTWDHQLMISLHSTDNNIPKFFTEVWDWHLTKTARILDNKLHETDPTSSKSFNREGIREINDIWDRTRCQELWINNKWKSKNIFLFKIGIRVFRISHPNDGFFSAHFFSKYRWNHIHFIVFG